MTATRLTVIVPAHNEAAVIGDNLHRLLDGVEEGAIGVIVVANGCSDDTAAVAAAVSPSIRVVELEEGSKIAALNAGDRLVVDFPVAYVDADVAVTGGAMLAVADALVQGAGVLVAAPQMVVDTRRSSWLVRQYYRVWEHTDYRRRALVGSGVYVLSREGRSRFGRFPSVIADDLYVLRLFRPTERLSVTDATFTVMAPATFRAHVRRSTRIAAGNAQLSAFHSPADPVDGSGVRSLLRTVIRTPRLWLAFPVYVVGYTIPRLRARAARRRGVSITWNRDDTTRVST